MTYEDCETETGRARNLLSGDGRKKVDTDVQNETNYSESLCY